MEKENILKEIQDYKCNRCIYNNEIYEFMKIGENYSLIKNFVPIKIKLNKKDWTQAAINYWVMYKNQFIEEKIRKDEKFVENRKNEILKSFFDTAEKMESYQKTGHWISLIPFSQTYYNIAQFDDGTIEKDILQQYDKIISEYPDFVEKAK